MSAPRRVVWVVVALGAVLVVALGVAKVIRADAAPQATGLMTSRSGYTLALVNPPAVGGDGVPVTFAIKGPDGQPVRAYELRHEKLLHLIAVRRDFTGFQHVHPKLSHDGIWATELDLTAGPWRLFADFMASGAEALTLGTDLALAGDYQPAENTGQVRAAQVDGYTVTLEGDLAAGSEAKLALSVERNGRPVTDLEPYLGAYGHLVALRGGDLAYLHVHPEGTPGDGTTQSGPAVVFYAAVPSSATYHLYLDFKHLGVVRTAAFTVTSAGVPESTKPDSHSGH